MLMARKGQGQPLVSCLGHKLPLVERRQLLTVAKRSQATERFCKARVCKESLADAWTVWMRSERAFQPVQTALWSDSFASLVKSADTCLEFLHPLIKAHAQLIKASLEHLLFYHACSFLFFSLIFIPHCLAEWSCKETGKGRGRQTLHHMYCRQSC